MYRFLLASRTYGDIYFIIINACECYISICFFLLSPIITDHWHYQKIIVKCHPNQQNGKSDKLKKQVEDKVSCRLLFFHAIILLIKFTSAQHRHFILLISSLISRVAISGKTLILQYAVVFVILGYL